MPAGGVYAHRVMKEADGSEQDVSDVEMRCGILFFQAEDGIRDVAVTGVQTCALPIFRSSGMIHAHPELPHELVLAGKETWFVRRVRDAARNSGVADRIRFLGFVSDDDLLHLYNACDLFCFPSFYEGFGLPVLEAMACGAAVACSNTPAIPEVAGGAAGLFQS